MNTHENVKKKLPTLVIETQYLGTVQYYARLLHHKNVLIEQAEKFAKSTYRNRCYIATADGELRLSIPLFNGKDQRKTIKDIKISYDHAWQRLHWHSLTAAYRSSPYFEFYEDDFYPFYHKKFTYLLDFNQQLCALILKALQADVDINYTQKFRKLYDEQQFLDFRSAIHPNPRKARKELAYQKAATYITPTYQQVFDDKLPFMPEVSIVDLLFNEGPNSATLLKNAFQVT